MRNSNIHTDRKATLVNSILNRTLMLYTFLLSLSVGQVNAADASSANIYYDNSSSKWSDVQILIGHDTYSSVATMTKLTNTNQLYYKRSYSWGGYSEFYFVTGCSGWGNEYNSPTHRAGYCTNSAKLTTNVGSKTWLFISSGGSDGSSVSVTDCGTSYDNLNYTYTVDQKLTTNGGSSYSTNTASLATVKVSSYYLANATNTSATATSGTIAASKSSASCKAVRTATVTYSVSSVSSDYNFVGWYDGDTQKSTDATYNDIWATENKTITARFTKNFTVGDKIYLLRNSTWKNASGLNHYAAYFYGAGGNTWVNCTQVGTSDYYYVTVPSGNWGYVIFVALNNATNNWSYKIFQTDDLMYDASHNGVEITGSNNSQSRISVYTGLSVSRTPTAAANAPTITNSQTVVKSGSSVTINAQDEKTGYHWVNWTKTSGTLDNANNKTTTFTPSANSASAVANYALNTYTVAYNANDAQYPGTATGSTSSSSHTYSVAKNLTSNGYTRVGYDFAGWATTPTGSVAYTNGQSVTNLSSTHNATVTLYAKWTAKSCDITLDYQTSAAGYASSGSISNAGDLTATYNAALTALTGTMPTAKNGYAFMGFYSGTNGSGTKYYNANGTSANNWAEDTESTTTLYAYYKKAEVSLAVSDAVIAPGETQTVTPTVSPTPTGTYEICFQLLHGNGNPMDEQPTFTKVSNTVTFTVPEVSGTYLVAAILHTGTGACGSGTELDSTTVAFQVAGDHSVSVRYKCGDDVIKASTKLEGIRPLNWSDEITAPDIIGYSFTGWTAGDGVTLTDDDGSTTKTSSSEATIKIKAIYDGYLTANYSKKRIIYFNNTLNWSSVYVYFYKNGTYWNNDNGTGCNTTYTYTDTPFSEGLYGQMLPIEEGSKIYYFDAEAAGVNASYHTVVFTELDQHTYDWFAKTGNVKNKVIKRDDYYSTSLPMFVPLAVQTPTPKNGNKADYYWQGYWMYYPNYSGYTLKIYDHENRSDYPTAIKSFDFPHAEDFTLPISVDVDLEANTKYYFEVYRNDNTYFGNNGDMKSGNSGPWSFFNTDTRRAGIQTTAAGSYNFNWSFYNGSDGYNYYMKVTYPIATNDYRVYYTDNATWSHSAHTLNSWHHPSGVITKNSDASMTKFDTVSFFISKDNSPAMKFQYASAINAETGAVTWTNVASGSITIPSAVVTESGVYNFIVKQVGTAKPVIEKVEKYTGNYYIRTDCANNKWDNYETDPDHLINYSEYSITHGGYSHYYTHWVRYTDTGRKNVKFCIANDYSPCISDTLARESASGTWANIATFMEEGGDLKRDANVRFMWNQSTNKISRAYVDGAQEDGSRFLVISSTDGLITKADGTALTNNEVTFSDNQNWIYEANIKAQPNAQIKLKSTWGEGTTIVQYFKGSSSKTETLIGGSGTTWYDIRLLYDFKTNRLVASWIPSGEITGDNAINADVMFIREHQGDIAQLTFHDGSSMISKIETAYGVIRFNKYTLNNKEKTGAHSPLASPLSPYERALYFISFPFRVKLSEVFGFGKYAQHWIIQYYDGAARAAEGYWAESNGFWKYVWDRKDFELEPNTGYLLGLDLDELTEGSSVWNNGVENVELFFPSYGTMPDIKTASVTHTIEAHTCTINRTTEGLPGGNDPRTTYDRRIVDSHWNVLSVPTYVNTAAESFANTDWITTGDGHLGPKFLYTWNMDDNTITATSGSSYVYKAMHAYMVQYYGNVTWNTSSSPASIVARHTYAEPPKEVEFRLELQQNGQRIDHAFIDISDNEETDANFAFGEDLCKEFNAYKANIYSFTADRVVVAGNTMPMSNHILSMPIGVQTTTAGDYTFALPDGTSGIGVTLFDSEENIRTNLSALNYTVTLPVGTFDNRFFLEISPVPQTPTGIDNSEVSNQPSGARKIIIDQQLYIIKDGKLYDARGVRIE